METINDIITSSIQDTCTPQQKHASKIEDGEIMGSPLLADIPA